MNRSAVLHKISKMMQNLYPDVETYLYGSYARGEATVYSDFDLLLLLPDSLTNKESKNLKYMIYDSIFEIEIEDNVNLSPLIIQKKLWESHITPFTINVNNEAIRI